MNHIPQTRVDAGAIKLAARGREVELLEQVAGLPTGSLDGKHHPCPSCGGVDRFRLLDHEAGAVYCSHCFREKNGDFLAAIRHFRCNGNFSEACRLVSEYLGRPHESARPCERPKVEAAAKPYASYQGNLESARLAQAVELDRAYSSALSVFSLTDLHRRHLRERGLNDEVISANQYRSFQASLGPKAYQAAFPDLSAESAAKVPGFYDLRLNAWPGILVPTFDHHGRIIGLQVRLDTPTGHNRYLWVTSNKRNGVSPGVPVHCPLGTPAHAARVRITEGHFKAEAAFAFDAATPTLAVAGVSNWKPAFHVLDALGAKSVSVAYDADFQENPNVREAVVKLAAAITKSGRELVIETWPMDFGKGIDDVIKNGKGTQITRLRGADALAFIANLEKVDAVRNVPPAKSPLPELRGGFDVHRVIDECIAALGGGGKVFRRGAVLCEIRGAYPGSDDVFIADIGESRLRDLLSSSIRYGEEVIEKGESHFRERHMPKWLLEGVLARGEFPNIPEMVGIADTPILSANGSIVSQRGMNEDGVFYHPGADFPQVPEAPTLEDAKTAVALLLEVVADFEFASPVGKSAWVAAALTPLARAAFSGPVPLMAIDAPTRGTGKSLLADTISLIATGRPAARISWGRDDEANRKLITAILLRGNRIAVLDNVNRLGGPALDAALTAETWADRVLGVSKMTAEIPARTMFVATGNNLTFSGDTARRVLPIRLETLVDRPEERSGFTHPDLLGHVRQNRPALVVAALTILRAYIHAGSPIASLAPWGSFEGWSQLVRGAIVWLGMADPCEAHRTVVEQSDEQLLELQAIIEAWENADPHRRGLTVREALTRIGAGDKALGDLFDELMPEGKGRNAKAIGRRLSAFKGRVANGLKFDVQVVHQTNRFSVRAPQLGSEGGFGDLMGITEKENPHSKMPANEGQSEVKGALGISSLSPAYAKVESYIDTHIGNSDDGRGETPGNPNPPLESCSACMGKLSIVEQTFDGYLNLECSNCGRRSTQKATETEKGITPRSSPASAQRDFGFDAALSRTQGASSEAL